MRQKSGEINDMPAVNLEMFIYIIFRFKSQAIFRRACKTPAGGSIGRTHENATPTLHQTDFENLNLW
jgi:hypothetical protein